ncbi:MAG: hypothetical protein VKJ02_17795 [Snowella sp.]|nr:hypothetical protein [Snowella sp.]
MALSPELFTPVARYLEEHTEAQRIQKLTFCLCKKYWENDPNVINSISLEQLLLELVQAKPTIEQLTFSMYKLVKTLNRPKVYAGVAKLILDQLGPVYQQISKSSQQQQAAEGDLTVLNQSFSKKETQIVDQDFLAEQIAHKLTNHSESSRMIKLLYAACKDAWENDPAVITQYGVKNLIVELRDMYPTKGEIQSVFNQLVANINKQTLYLAIANLILSQMDCLYDNFDADESVEEGQKSQILKTQILQTDKPLALVNANRQRDIQTSIIDINAEPIATVLKSSSNLDTPAPGVTLKTYNLFEMRLEIMQYTNPLRAKILLFSILFHSWDKQGKDWDMLRGYGLGDLIEQVLISGKTMTEIESKLYTQAKTFSDTESYLQTAGTVVQSLKSAF